MEEKPNRAEAERLLGIAERLLQSRDLNGSREFAILSQEADPFLDGSDQILAVVDVLLAGEQNRVNNHADWYAVLGVDPRRSTGDQDLIKRQYRRLALLLHPDKNRYAFADQAFQLVADAWNVLSTSSKKSLFDGELNLFFTKVDLNHREKEKLPTRRAGGAQRTPPEAAATATPSLFAAASFWTACPYCYGLYEYPRIYEECCVRCQNCRRAFHAARISQLPPLVPERDEYYCCWGFFPMGFVNGKEDDSVGTAAPAAAAAAASDSSRFPSWMPPIFPTGKETAANGGGVPVGGGSGGLGTGRDAAKRESPAARVPDGVSQDGVPKKRGRGRPRKNPLP